jgi:hypothetical protein
MYSPNIRFISNQCARNSFDHGIVSSLENLNDLITCFSVSGGELFDRVVDDNYILTETAVAIIMNQICEVNSI